METEMEMETVMTRPIENRENGGNGEGSGR
jgi:hypothetical protein